jgi:hypothetical protein
MLSSPFALRTENPEVLHAVEQEYLAEWQPLGRTERDLVMEMALCRFRQSRIVAVEVAAWDLQMDKDAPAIERDFGSSPDNAVRSAIAFQNLANETRTLDLTNRYETRFHRQYMRALDRLRELQDDRLGAGRRPASESAPADLPNEPEPGAGATPETPAARSQEEAVLPNEPGKMPRPTFPVMSSPAEPGSPTGTDRSPTERGGGNIYYLLVSDPDSDQPENNEPTDQSVRERSFS